MNKSGLVNAVAEKTGLTKKDTEQVINETLAAITETLANGDKVQLIGFGNFEVRDTKERNGVNPKLLKELKEQGVDEATAKAQASVYIPASKKPAFKAAKALKDTVKE
ncbi:HU family DNA-binding protein [Paenibacillus barcinonensis]|uniref:DNA-binding protein HU-beta n=1 Tax=Paenibacillus barcinonensis TaxID=198119 RepID=A0A2V4W0H9_PAEBA|nr:HU family DNA-binding protein [Paenibacillus barcinonensis]PYE51625.1 DNA-binding protein HU-beta [Paenibacillus barcinonensis]QKS55989.1 HU family DNA-binding protein [Paenibacillus barcinonensis]